MRRVAAWFLVVAGALVLAGCEDVQQRSARRSVETYLRALPDEGGYDVGTTRCTTSARMGFVNVIATSGFVCLTHRRNGICDRFQILNFAPAPLQVPDHVTLRSVNMALELEILSYELMNRRP